MRWFGHHSRVEKGVSRGWGSELLSVQSKCCRYVSGWWLDFEGKTTGSNDWIGCNFKPSRGHTFMNLVLEKITILLFERNKPIIKILLKDISKQYKRGSSVKVDGISDGIIWSYI